MSSLDVKGDLVSKFLLLFCQNIIRAVKAVMTFIKNPSTPKSKEKRPEDEINYGILSHEIPFYTQIDRICAIYILQEFVFGDSVS